ncbi:cell division protein FtsZ [Enterobacter hormaechei]|nr:cell division protein FtsZ [Enterobacter hormaechei]
MINHYGTTPLIRQCVTPGMMAMHEGRTYRVSAVIQERKWVYLHTDAEIIRLSDCVIDVLLDGHGTLSSTNHPIQPIGLD